jgi:hypothetical protein
MGLAAYGSRESLRFPQRSKVPMSPHQAPDYWWLIVGLARQYLAPAAWTIEIRLARDAAGYSAASFQISQRFAYLKRARWQPWHASFD